MKKLMLLLLLLLAFSCVRRDLEEVFYDTAKIPVSIDWSATELDPDTDKENLYRASVYLFANSGTPFDGASYKEYKLSSATYDDIAVPMGEYSVVIFNNSTSEFSRNVDFRGLDSYDDFEYYALDDNTRSSDGSYKLEPDILGAWRTDDFTVTSEMVLESRGYSVVTTKTKDDLEQLLGVVPERLTHTVTVRVYAINISSATSAVGSLIGVAHTVKLASGTKSTDGSSLYFTSQSRSYDSGSTSDGYLEAVFETIGLINDEDGEYYLEVRFILTEEYDYSLYYPALSQEAYRFNVTDQILEQQDQIHILLEVGFDGDGDGTIELPKLNISGGFQPDIGDWGDEEQLEI